jgi:PhnB protein
MHLDTYLKFDGNCREAFEFYRSAFNGEFLTLQTFGDGPPGMGVDPAYLDRVMHVSLPIGPSVLMGSDAAPGFGPPIISGNNFSIMIHAGSREEADSMLAKLSAGGLVTMPLQDTFWGAYFGSLTDKFGVNWQIHYNLTQA